MTNGFFLVMGAVVEGAAILRGTERLAETIATFQAAGVTRLFTQGIGLRPSALGWNLPARWAGGMDGFND
jgi:hypothetical protein